MIGRFLMGACLSVAIKGVLRRGVLTFTMMWRAGGKSHCDRR